MAKFNDDLSDLDDDLDARLESGKHKAAPIISDIPSYKAPSAVLDTVEDDDFFEDDAPSGQFDDVKNRAKQKANSDKDMSDADKDARRLINAKVKVGLAVRLCKLGFKYLYKSFVQGKFAAKVRFMITFLTKKKADSGLNDEEKDNLLDLYALQEGIKTREEKYDKLLIFE